MSTITPNFLYFHKGIPPSVRGIVWPLLVGNNLEITTELYDIFRQRQVVSQDK